MKKAYLRFYEELNDFLPQDKKKIRFEYEFTGTPSVKDIIESMGVPHTEIDMILVNGTSVSFSHKLTDSDDVSIYPVFESFDIKEQQHLRPFPLRDPKFVLDVHLGSLARYMRMGGFDALYRNNYSDKELVEISINERRTILTKDKEILKRNDVTHGYWVRNVTSEDQLKEVIKRFQLENQIVPFTRCIECNELLQTAEKSDVLAELPEKVKEWHDEFKKCPKCGRTYWKGSHYEKMHSFIDKLTKSL
jgi:hypothetical protein